MPRRADADTYQYRQNGASITVTYTCDDGTIVPGPHPMAIIERRKSTLSITAHSVDKLDAAMQQFAGYELTDEAEAFLHDLLARTTCPVE